MAVPITVVATSLKMRRQPSRRQVIGAIASVAGIAVLTVLLLTPAAQPLLLPPWWLIAGTVSLTVGLSSIWSIGGGRCLFRSSR